jgi:integrase
MRPGAVELLSLTWGNVNWDGRTIEVLSARKGGPIRRTVDLHPDFFPILAAWHKDDQALFKEKKIGNRPIIHWRKKPIRRIHKTWWGTLERANITRRLRPYDMRHWFVSRAIEGGADIKTISEIVGSSPRTLMQTYQHVSNPQRRQAIAKMKGLGWTEKKKGGKKK